MWDDVLRISKKYADPLHFRFVDVGPTQQTLDAIKESFNADDFAEIIFLSKYIGQLLFSGLSIIKDTVYSQSG